MARIGLSVVLVALFAVSPLFGQGGSRIKDIAEFEGVRQNTLTGYGLVIGLNNTGDRNQTYFTAQSLTNMLERAGITVDQAIRVRNVAAVMVTAFLPAFARSGSTIDVTVSSIGDASSLQGGVLLQTPLVAQNNEIYAVAQGSLVLGGFSAGNATTGVTVNHPTTARIPNGAIVEREVVVGVPETIEFTGIVLHEADFTNSSRVSRAVNEYFGAEIARSIDARTIRVGVPAGYQTRPIEFFAELESIPIEMDLRARVAVNERTGSVSIGRDVRIAPVSISHGNLTIQIDTDFQVSQPQAFSDGETVVVPDQAVTVEEQLGNFVTIDGGSEGATVDDLIAALNALGVTPRDTVAILQLLAAHGALRAELEVL